MLHLSKGQQGIISRASTLLNDLVAWWSLDETSGSRVDSHTNALTLTDNNTCGSGTGVISNAADFIAANDEFLSRASEALLSPGDTDFTFALWQKIDSFQDYPGPLGKWSPATASENEYAMAYSTAGGGNHQFNVTGGVTQTGVDSGVTASTGTWYLTIVWHDSVNNLIGISVNDSVPVTAAHTAGVNQGSEPFSVGRYYTNIAYTHDGLIDEIGYWSKVLSAAERTELYNSGSGIGYPGYDPGTMYYGSIGHYNKTSVTTTGNKLTVVMRFNQNSYTGTGNFDYIAMAYVNARQRFQVVTYASDYSTADYQDKVNVVVLNTSGAIICSLYPSANYLDGQDHTLFFSFDGDAGTAVFYVDGVDADDTGNASRVAPTTGTLDTSSTGEVTVGAWPAGLYPFSGSIGYFGYRDAYLTNPTDFHHPTNGLQELDESGWTEWGAQPLFWNQYGTMTDNQGSGGNMTKNGTITGPT